MDREEAFQVLQNAPLFTGLPDSFVRRIFESGSVVDIPAGEQLFAAGDAGDALFVILKGAVAIQEDNVGLAVRRAGDPVGEFAVLDLGQRSASAVVETDTSLFRWECAAVRATLEQSPALAWTVIGGLVSKLREIIPARVEAVRREQDLLRAREIQRAMLPERDLKTSAVELAGWCQPALVVGGDYFDYVDLGRDCVSLTVSDVEGKGLPASLTVAVAKGCYINQTAFDAAPAAVAGALNKVVSGSAGQKMMTSFCALLDARQGLLHYSNAAHPSSYLCHGDGLELLPAIDRPLGFPGLEDRVFLSQTRPWRTGDVLVAYSDGVTDATNKADERFDSHGLEKFLRETPRASAAAVREALALRIKNHIGDARQPDDITILVARAT